MDTAAEILATRTRGLGTKIKELIVCRIYSTLPTDLQAKVSSIFIVFAFVFFFESLIDFWTHTTGSAQGSIGNEYCRDLADNRWNHLRDWHRVLQAEVVQSKDWYAFLRLYCYCFINLTHLFFFLFKRYGVPDCHTRVESIVESKSWACWPCGSW